MIAYALILLAEAAAPCATDGATRLGGGAVIVRPVGNETPAPIVYLGPAPSVVSEPAGIQQVGARKPDAKPETGQDQCKAGPIHIV